jgi:hypothetical protein
LRCIQRKLQRTIRLKQPWSSRRIRAPVIPNLQRITGLRKRRVRMRLVIRKWIPHHRRSCTRNDTICGPYRVCVSILTYCADREMRGCGEERGEVPGKGDILALSYFEEGSRCLRGLSDCDATRCSGLGNGRGSIGGRGTWGGLWLGIWSIWGLLLWWSLSHDEQLSALRVNGNDEACDEASNVGGRVKT